jgi:catechol 2,3-dioxygenase-like lactoylglutathione lyase family enzyme
MRRQNERLCVAGAALLLASLAAAGSQMPGRGPAGSVLGTGRGLDHVIVIVRDLDAAARTFADVLGFTVIRGGSFPSGLRNGAVMFESNYIELMSVDPSKVSADHELVRLLQKREGGYAFALNVSSARDTAQFLRARDIEVAGPTGSAFVPEGSKEVQTSLWQSVAIKKPALPYQPMFFIEYPPRKTRPPVAEHRNTATGIRAVWIAVKDLDAAAKAYEAVGLPTGRQVRVPQLGADGREIGAGQGAIVLLRSNDGKGPLASHLQQHGEGVVGISIEARDLDAARSILRAASGEALNGYDSLYGRAILIEPALTHGVWIELFMK